MSGSDHAVTTLADDFFITLKSVGTFYRCHR